MEKEYYSGNRQNFYKEMKNGSVAVFFSGDEIRKSGDECYDYFGNRNFLYLTGIQEPGLILLAVKEDDGQTKETLYLRTPDFLQERWCGKRIKAEQAEEISGIHDFKYVTEFKEDFHWMVIMGRYQNIYLDAQKYDTGDIDQTVHHFRKYIRKNYSYLKEENGTFILRKLRTIKQPCEIESMRRAEEITGEGIRAMMKASRPGMYEYQYKAEYDYVLGQYGTEGSGFPSIISAGENNFCIHYYEYSGQAKDGDMILNDVGARWNGLVTDVSRGWPCNGKFTDRQKALYNCALATSDHMFEILKPGFKMMDVDETARRYNFERLKDIGVCKNYEDIGTYMWHGGAHHVGYDCHDMIAKPEVIKPGMVFCVDIGIYHEKWGIGFRVEDNCLITEDGCENLSRHIPRTIPEIEDYILKNNIYLRK